MPDPVEVGLPTEIPWRRICVTENMIEPVVCAATLPPKWQSSLAVYRYDPDETQQIFPEYDISYLKVTATVAGYQALDDEIRGEIDWSGLHREELQGLAELLDSYHPCHGAVIQVVVGPDVVERGGRLERYPFFMDFEPKRRTLYELASDTQEKQSRSLEVLHVTKSGGSARSLEIMDVETSRSPMSFQASVSGTGGGFTLPGATEGQWGTRRMNSEQAATIVTGEAGQERRELYSHTTQLTQLYHLLDSYHLGTNRAVFLMQPRPHVLEQSATFVRGPRPIEGIQEFFLVVAKPKGEPDFCVSVRLDTGHLMEVPILDFDHRSALSERASASAPIPTVHDPSVESTVSAHNIWGNLVEYACHGTFDDDHRPFAAPPGYRIAGWSEIGAKTESGSGRTWVTEAPDRKSLTVHAEATGHACFKPDLVWDAPGVMHQKSGEAQLQVQVNLVSEEPVNEVGEEKQLLITTQALCCCRHQGVDPTSSMVRRVSPVPAESGGLRRTGDSSTEISAPSVAVHVGGTDTVERDSSGEITIRQANALSEFIKSEMLRGATPSEGAMSRGRVTDGDLVAQRLLARVRRNPTERSALSRALVDVEKLPEASARRLAQRLSKKPGEVTLLDVVTMGTEDLSDSLRQSVGDITRLKLRLLGLKFQPPAKPKAPGRRRATKSTGRQAKGR